MLGCAAACALVISFPPALHAQQIGSATIVGMVSDPTGHAVTGSEVTLTKTTQGTSRTLATSGEGTFSFTDLDAGLYEISVKGTEGFSSYEQSVQVEVGQQLQIPVHLKVGPSETRIEVSSAASQIQTETSVVGGVIESKQIENLPLNGRNYLELALLVPGNAPAPNFDPTKQHTVVISSAGQVGRGGNVTIDGADNNDDAVGGSLVNIPEDAVQEFQIATNRFSAALGRSGSAVTNVVTKQGGNEIHGSAAMYERDKVLQGLPATYDRTINTTPPFHRQQYAGDLGGPIRKDKAWWFVAAEDRQQAGADLVGVRNLTTHSIDRTFSTSPLHDFLATTRADWQINDRDRFGVRASLELEDDLVPRPRE
jgi:Carboxypeptidase regulatory-like domain